MENIKIFTASRYYFLVNINTFNHFSLYSKF